MSTPKHQLAEILIKTDFTRNEWNNFFYLFIINHFSSTCCVENSILINCPHHDGEKDAGTKGRRKKCGKINIYSDEPVFSCSVKFFIREKSDCIQMSWDTHGYGETWKQDEKKFNQAPGMSISYKDRIVLQSTRVSNHNSSYRGVFSIVSEIYAREHNDHMNDLDVNRKVWGIFLNATFRAAVHVGWTRLWD